MQGACVVGLLVSGGGGGGVVVMVFSKYDICGSMLVSVSFSYFLNQCMIDIKLNTKKNALNKWRSLPS